MSADDPTLPGRPRRSLSSRSLRVLGEVRPLVEVAFSLPAGPARDDALAEAIARAIDLGRESGKTKDTRITQLEGDLNDARQQRDLLREKVARLTKALDEAQARIARGDR